MPPPAATMHSDLLAVLEEGQGRPVIWLHAFPLDRGMWASQLYALSGTHRVITVDTFGFGVSGSPAGGWGVDLMADALAEWLENRGVAERVVVAGLSMGGYIALAFARRHPGRLAGLILADTRAEADGPDARAGREAAIAAVQAHGSSAQVEAMLPKALGATSHAQRPGVVAQFRHTGIAQTVEAVVAGLRALRDRPDALPTLASIAVPTLVLVGAEDTLTPPSAAEVLANGIPGAKFVVIPGAGHLSNLEAPDAFNTAVLDFLNTLPQPR